MDLNRREFLKGGAVLGGAAFVGGLVGCTPDGSSGSTDGAPTSRSTPATEYPFMLGPEDFKDSAAIFEPITEFAEEKTYDLVVIGAGTSGMPAVLTALEEGATVACLQKEEDGVSQGNGASGFIAEETTPEGFAQWKHEWTKAVSFRYNPALLDYFLKYSGETACWLGEIGEKVGYPPATRSAAAMTKRFSETSVCTFISNNFGIKPENNGFLIRAMCRYAEENGAEMFYKTPGVQLVMEGGVCKGVIGRAEDGSFIKFNATKGVIVAAGDYQNNESLLRKFSPDLVHFAKKQYNKTGDGILMVMAAGGEICPVMHTKQMHDMDAAPMVFAFNPFLALDQKGERFMNEDISMEQWNQLLRFQDAEDKGHFFRIFDGNYLEYTAAWGNPPVPPETLENYIPGFLDAPKGVYTELTDTHRADSLEELAEELSLDPTTFVASVERYNELCKAGLDEDFGKDPKYLCALETPPYWGIRQWIRLTATGGGFKVDGNYQALNSYGEPIQGLYGAGFTAGDLIGDVDWSIYLGGLSCGSCFTSGRYTAIHALTGSDKPSMPVTWSTVKGKYMPPVS